MAPTPHDTQRAPGANAAGQTELFPPAREEAAAPTPRPTPPSPPASGAPAQGVDPVAMRQALLDLCAPVRAGGRTAAWLKAHRIFKKTWDAQSLRVVDNYRRVADGLLAAFPLAALQAGELFNKDGHLRFYRHSLLVPWFDGGRPAYLHAYAPDDEAGPAVLSASGPVPCPYNARLLDGAPGRLYLCAGVLETMEFLEAGFPAVGVPRLPSGTGAREGAPLPIKNSWLTRFRNKSVYIAFDGDAEGEAAAASAMTTLAAAAHLGVEAHRLAVPAGKRVGEWLAGR